MDVAAFAGIGLMVTKIVDTLRNAFDANDTAPKWLWNVVAFAAGISSAFLWDVNVLDAATKAQEFAGTLLTGFGLGAAAGGWHELLDMWSSNSKTP